MEDRVLHLSLPRGVPELDAFNSRAMSRPRTLHSLHPQNWFEITMPPIPIVFPQSSITISEDDEEEILKHAFEDLTE